MPPALVDYAAISNGPYESEDQVSWWEVLYLALYLEGQTRLALQHRAPQSLAQSKSHRAAQASAPVTGSVEKPSSGASVSDCPSTLPTCPSAANIWNCLRRPQATSLKRISRLNSPSSAPADGTTRYWCALTTPPYSVGWQPSTAWGRQRRFGSPLTASHAWHRLRLTTPSTRGTVWRLSPTATARSR